MKSVKQGKKAFHESRIADSKLHTFFKEQRCGAINTEIDWLVANGFAVDTLQAIMLAATHFAVELRTIAEKETGAGI